MIRLSQNKTIHWQRKGCLDEIMAHSQYHAIPYSQFYSDLFTAHQTLKASSSDSILLYCENSYHFLVSFYALILLGKNIILPPNIQEKTLENLNNQFSMFVHDSHETFHFSNINTASFLNRSSNNEERTETQLNDEAANKTTNSFEDWLNDLTHFVHDDFLQSNITFFTSGSTGDPKSVTKRLNHLLAEVAEIDQLWKGQIGCHVISTVTHQHIYGLLFRLLWPLSNDVPFSAFRFEYPEQIEESLNQLGKATLVCSPAHLTRIKDVLHYDVIEKNIVSIFSSGGPLSMETSRFYLDSFSKSIIEVLGSTETGGIASRQQSPNNPNGLWDKFPSVTLSLQQETEQLQVESPFIGDDEQPFLMGDRATLLSDHRFLLNGRADRVVKIEEKRVSLNEVERALRTSDLVSDIKVITVTGKRTVLGCIIILSESGKKWLPQERKPLINALRKHCLTFFEPVVLPRKWRFVESFPCNSLGKTAHSQLLELFEPTQPL